jgi:hypothetical protein
MRRPQWFDDLADPGIRAGVILVAVAIVGLAVLSLAWRGVARSLYVGVQLPFLISAGIGGAALAGTGAALFGMHLERRAAAVRRADVDEIVRTVAGLADNVRRRRGQAVSRPFVLLRSTVHRRDCRIVSDRDDVTPVGAAQAREARACRICKPLADSA